MTLTEALQKICSDPQLHARWLNSLSYLEYRGFRKIVRSHSSAQISWEVLLHMNEELRHATFFKRHAINVGGQKFDSYSEETLLNKSALREYFTALDERTVAALTVEEDQTHASAPYWAVTGLIETRALEIYEEYNRVLIDGHFPFSLTAILQEERGHLREMHAKGLDARPIGAIESEEFGKLWQSIKAEL
jgi:hypothetical protein